MVPSTFTNFFLATSSGGAALIGLLFVATSISPERVFSAKASPELTAVATSAFTALTNAFFISTAGLIPGTHIGDVAVALALVGALNSLSLGRRLAQSRWENRRSYSAGRLWLRIARDLLLVAGSLVIYVLELTTAIQLINNPGNPQRPAPALYTLATLILVVYALGLLRAWELLGARRGGLLGWLNPLEQPDLPPTEAQPAGFTGSAEQHGKPV